MSLPRDVYTIRNKGSGTFTDLSGGSNTNGAQVQGWEDEGASASFSFNQRWLITPVNGTPGAYKMQNLHSGTFVDLSNGSPSNDTKVQGWEGSVNDTNKNQQWVISGAEVAGFWRVQNVASGTYMNLLDITPNDGTPIVGWEHFNNDNQLWTIQPATLSGAQINATLIANPSVQQKLPSFFQDPGTKYVTIPSVAIQSVFQALGVPPSNLLSANLDSPAYALKAAVAKWSNDIVRVDGFPILFGIVFMLDAQGVPHAQNWSIQDNTGVIFFDPFTGSQSSNLGHKVYSGFY